MEVTNSTEALTAGEYAAHSVMNEVFKEGGKILYAHYLEDQSLPFAVKSTIEMLTDALSSVYVQYDSGDSSDWTEVAEPKCCERDPWMRSIIKTRMRPKKRQGSSSLEKSKQSYIAKSIHHHRVPSQQSPCISICPEPINEVKESIPTEENVLRDKKERQIRLKKQAIERQKKLKEEEEELIKKKEREEEELKKKVFTYNKNGDVLVIDPVKTEKLPPISLLSRFHLPVSETIKYTQKEVAAVKPRKPRTEKEFIRNTTDLPKPIIESINLAPGVSITQGKQSKFSPILQSKTLSRTEYNMLAKRKAIDLLPGSSYHQSLLSENKSVLKVEEEEIKRLDIDDIPDYETSGFLPEVKTPVMPKKSIRTSRIIQYSKFEPNIENLGPVDKFNLDILKNRNWGINPPVKEPSLPSRLPSKVTYKDIRETHGNLIKKPKDQPFVTNQELWIQQRTLMKKPRDRPFVEKTQHRKRLTPSPNGLTVLNKSTPL